MYQSMHESKEVRRQVAMTSITLDLGRISLTSSADRLKLSATCAGSFQFPQFTSTMNHADILQAFISGHIYTTRGIGCSLNIRVLSDGKALDNATQPALRDKLGRQLLNAQVSYVSAGTNQC